MEDIVRKQATLDYLSNQIDIWGTTAAHKKHIITSWRKRIFVLVIVGTLFGLLSQVVARMEERKELDWNLHAVLAISSAVAVALSSFAGAQILNSNLEKTQIKSRSAAEALKVQGYLYLMRAAPYNRNNADKIIYERVESILKGVEDITPDFDLDKEVSPGWKWTLRILSLGLYNPFNTRSRYTFKFDANMDFEQYFNKRVQGQINGYYLKKAAEFQRIINRGNAACLIFGFLGVAVGSVAASTNGNVAMWIAFLGTASASIGSYLHSNKYEYLMLSYVSTASNLELLAAKHQSMGAASEALKRRFVAETERVLSSEHSSWISEISGLKEDDEETLLMQSDMGNTVSVALTQMSAVVTNTNPSAGNAVNGVDTNSTIKRNDDEESFNAEEQNDGSVG